MKDHPDIDLKKHSLKPGRKPKKGSNYSEQEKEFIRDYWEDLTDKEIAEQLGRPYGSVQNARRLMGLVKFSRKEWTSQEEQIVKDLYPDTPNEEILKKIPRHSIASLYRKAHALGINKSDEYLQEQNKKLGKALAESDAAKRNRYDKGHTPVNKGLRQEEFMSQEAIKRTKATRFKKGHKPHNTLFNGAITIRHSHKDPERDPEVWIRLAEGEWQLYNRYQYEKNHGPIPEKHIVAFKDGNTLNCHPENLECISMAENMERNRNPEKAAESMRKHWEKHPHPARSLSDNYIAGHLSGGDCELRDYIVEHRQDLIKVARANYKLRRSIRNGSTKNKRQYSGTAG